MQVETAITNPNEVVELTIEDLEIVSGGFPVVPPLKPGG
jgi:hypothetical protein